MSQEAPTQILLAFLDELPDTIRQSVIFRISVYSELFEYKEKDSMRTLRNHLSEEKGVIAAGRTIRMVGATEVSLFDSPHAEEVLGRLSETGDQLFEVGAMQLPLRKRHMEIARQAFADLRKNALSSGSLAKWAMVLALENAEIPETTVDLTKQ